jgi:acyl-CoA synthetase (AMP-forming)/AMP-acid ligase II
MQIELTDRARLVAELTAPGAPFELVEQTVRGIPMRVYAGAPPTLRDVLLLSRQHGDLPFLVYQDERASFAEHFRLAAGLAVHLRERYHLEPGDRIAVAMRNYPEWAPAFWAAQAAGLIVVPVNAWWTGDEIRYALTDSGAKLLVADSERVASLLPDLAGLPVIEVRGATPAKGVRAWRDVLAELDPDAELPDIALDPDDDATIMYTSGTTGRPKGAVGTHRNHCTNLWNTLLGLTIGKIIAGGGTMPEPDPAAPQPGTLVTFPIFHIAGLTGMCFATLAGAKLATLYRWDRDQARKLVRREQLTGVSGVPTVLRDLVAGAADYRDDLASLAGVSMGGAPIPPDLIGSIDSTFATLVSPANGYGLTETTSAVASNSGADYVSHPDSVGRPVPGADLRIADPATGDPLPDGEVGELWFRGPNVVRGYWHNPEATAAAFTGGWFHTGDLGYVRDGWLYVVDRIKDMVIRGGENVYCVEVEDVLFDHPAVTDAAVLGRPHATLGEEVVAVVRAGGATAEELKAHVAAKLAPFKVPEHVIFTDRPLPRTPTGKVLKRRLRDEIRPEGQ